MLRYFSFAGMQRSGNHGIINWWLHHFQGWYFRNNILGLTCEHPEAQCEVVGDYQHRVRCDSWENYDPFDLTISPLSDPLVVILRDPYNWLASWMPFTIPNPNIQHVPREKTIEWYLHYIEYAWEFPDQAVIFNKWVSSSDYRREIEDRFDLGESDVGLDSLAKIAGPSTFDGYSKQGKAQEMRVLERWKHMRDYPRYLDVFASYPQLADISSELFDFEPPEGLHT